MAEIINVNDITNGYISNGEWSGTGIFDKLIDAVNNNLAIQLEAGRLTNSEFGSVYSNIVPAVLNSSIDFVLKKRLTEKEIEIKSKQLAIEYINMIIKDKEAVKFGMDKAFANNNANLKDVYTPIYKEVI